MDLPMLRTTAGYRGSCRMESLDAFLLMRMIERLLGLLTGGLCVVLGYRLFINLPDKTDASGKVVLPGGVSIWLSRVGPGVFFALFGAAIVGYSFASTVKATSEQTSPLAKVSSGAAGEAAVTSRQEIAAMTDRSGGSTSKDGREQQLVVLRGAMADVNATIVRLERDAGPPERDRLIGGLQTTKMLLIRAFWEPAWGDPVRFQTWINSGAVLPAPAGMDAPAALYLAGRSQ
jgi:hypothetical protein